MKKEERMVAHTQTPTIQDVSEIFHLDQPISAPVFKSWRQEQGLAVPEVDNAYHFNPEVTQAISLALRYDKRVLVNGLHGTGKSTHIEQVAARLNWPCLRLNLDAYLTRADLLGRDIITQDKSGNTVTRFQEGLLVWAIKNPVMLILDEYDAARPELLFIFQQLLESDGKLVFFDEATVVKPHPYFRLFATCNTLGFGDEYGLYQGTQLLNQGHLDRWNIILSMDFMDQETEEKVLLKRVPALDKAKLKPMVTSMVGLANLTRGSFRHNGLSLFMSPRALFSWAELVVLFKDLRRAFELSFLNRVPVTDQPLLEELYQRAFGAKDYVKILEAA